ncbi:MAG: hypothetical protein HYY08_02340 [Firmicutes bacterium]|nr:hypothetical protein [Bacillota bacterium]
MLVLFVAWVWGLFFGTNMLTQVFLPLVGAAAWFYGVFDAYNSANTLNKRDMVRAIRSGQG